MDGSRPGELGKAVVVNQIVGQGVLAAAGEAGDSDELR